MSSDALRAVFYIRDPRNHEAVPRPVVAWIGSSGNHRDLTVAREALRQVLAEGTVRFRVISDRPLRAAQWAGAEWVPWSVQAAGLPVVASPLAAPPAPCATG